MRVEVTGNDFHGDSIGVLYVGSGGGIIGSDLGGGNLNSLGGNNFRDFTKAGKSDAAAIVLNNVAVGAVLSAESNLFATGALPANVVFVAVASSKIDATGLNANRSYVQSLYNNLLARSGAMAELDGWVPLLTSQGPTAVSRAVLHSSEALGRIVDGFYQRFLGRDSEPAGRNFYIGELQANTSAETVQAQFINSPEYLGHINTDYVHSLYLNILHRTGSAPELAAWNNVLPKIGFAGVANSFAISAENRQNSAMEDFSKYLHRPASAADLLYWSNLPLDLVGIQAEIMGTAEAFSNM